MTTTPTMGRPKVYADSATLELKPRKDAPRLQRNSERRQIIDFLLERNGTCTLADASEQFGRQRVLALVRAGWLRFQKKKEAAA
jgi:hypothetical protein